MCPDPQLHPAVQPQLVQGAAFALPLIHFGNKNFEGNSEKIKKTILISNSCIRHVSLSKGDMGEIGFFGLLGAIKLVSKDKNFYLDFSAIVLFRHIFYCLSVKLARLSEQFNYEESVVVRIKSNLLLMIFWLHIINYNS